MKINTRKVESITFLDDNKSTLQLGDMKSTMFSTREESQFLWQLISRIFKQGKLLGANILEKKTKNVFKKIAKCEEFDKEKVEEQMWH